LRKRKILNVPRSFRILRLRKHDVLRKYLAVILMDERHGCGNALVYNRRVPSSCIRLGLAKGFLRVQEGGRATFLALESPNGEWANVWLDDGKDEEERGSTAKC